MPTLSILPSDIKLHLLEASISSDDPESALSLAQSCQDFYKLSKTYDAALSKKLIASHDLPSKLLENTFLYHQLDKLRHMPGTEEEKIAELAVLKEQTIHDLSFVETVKMLSFYLDSRQLAYYWLQQHNLKVHDEFSNDESHASGIASIRRIKRSLCSRPISEWISQEREGLNTVTGVILRIEIRIAVGIDAGNTRGAVVHFIRFD